MFKKPIFELLVNFLLGIAWAIALLGAVFTFYDFYTTGLGLITSIISAIIGSLAGLLLVLILEVINLNISKYKNSQKQTEVLEDILSELKKLSNN